MAWFCYTLFPRPRVCSFNIHFFCVCVHRNVYIPRGLCRAQRKTLGVGPHFHLIWDNHSLLLTPAYAGLDGWRAYGSSLVSSSHLTVGVLGSQAWAAAPGFIWALGTQLHAPMASVLPLSFLRAPYIFRITDKASNFTHWFSIYFSFSANALLGPFLHFLWRN